MTLLFRSAKDQHWKVGDTVGYFFFSRKCVAKLCLNELTEVAGVEPDLGRFHRFRWLLVSSHPEFKSEKQHLEGGQGPHPGGAPGVRA